MNEEGLRKALRIAMRALNIIVDTGASLKDQLDEDVIDSEYAFASLHRIAELERMKTQDRILRIQEGKYDGM